MRWRHMKKQNPETWHNWFAWYPVALTEHGGYSEVVVWFESIQRQLVGVRWRYRA